LTGFKLSLLGAALFFTGLILLVVLPVGVPIAAMVIGGLLVWSGFIWTIFGGYVKPSPPSPPEA
jgi:hypothetical protein